MRYIVMYFGSVDRPLLERLKDRSGVEVYRLGGPDFEYQIDMALLMDMVTPCKLAFVGGVQAKTFAKGYGGTWIEDTPSVNEDLLAFWGCC